MADDTRQPSSDPAHQAFKAVPRDPSQAEHKKPRAFIHRPNEDAAGAEEARKQASILEAAKSIQLDDFTKVHTTPCVRNALLPAIGGGMGVGALRFVIGGSIMASCNWASGSFVGFSLIAYQWCQRRRALEKDGIRRAVQVLDQKQALKDLQEKARKAGEAGTLAVNELKKQGINAEVVKSDVGGVGPRQNVPFWQTFKFW